MVNLLPTKRSARGRSSLSNAESWDVLRQKHINGTEQIFDTLREIELAIDEVREALLVSQPPVNKRIDIRWWSMKGFAETPLLHPTLVRWIRKGNKAYPKPLKRLNVRREGTSAINADQVVELVNIARDLIEVRQTLLKRLHIMRQQSFSMNHRSLAIENKRAITAILKNRSIENLVEHGYEVCGIEETEDE